MTSDQMAPPGWYDNPEKAGEVRLWDGAAWTDETRPKAPPMPPPAAFAPSSTGFDHSYPTEQPLGAAQSYGAAAVSYGIASGPGPAQPGSGGAQSFGLGGGYQAPQAFTQAGPGPGFGQATNWGPASRAKWGTPHGPGRGIRRVGSLAYMAFAVVFGLIWVAVGLLLLHADSTPSGQTATATGIVTSVSATIGADSGCRPT
ncbi:MAG TPA: DUF2510 domain-containing protein, partial [Acidimicrobiales bacterium]|nr:DUF2510 domain-containing protein [Acidimicrobiales bacterium]